MDNRKQYLDIVKIFACFMVVVNHTNGFILENKTFVNMTFYCIMFSICKVGVGLFLMITGALTLKKTYSYEKVLKCIIRVFVPVFGLSLIFYVRDVGVHNINIIYFLKSILSNPYVEPYWYVYALVSIYLVLPFVQKMVKNFNCRDYRIFIVLFLVIPSFINLLKNYMHLDINFNFKLAFFPVIITFVICGNYIAEMKLSKKVFVVSIIIFAISYVGMFLSMYVPYLKNGEISYNLDSYDAFPVIFMCMSLFYIGKFLFEGRTYSTIMVKAITIITSTTFGIYLLHTILKYKLYKLEIMQRVLEFNSVVAIIFLDFLVFAVCMVIVYLLKKIPIIERFL